MSKVVTLARLSDFWNGVKNLNSATKNRTNLQLGRLEVTLYNGNIYLSMNGQPFNQSLMDCNPKIVLMRLKKGRAHTYLGRNGWKEIYHPSTFKWVECGERNTPSQIYDDAYLRNFLANDYRFLSMYCDDELFSASKDHYRKRVPLLYAEDDENVTPQSLVDHYICKVTNADNEIMHYKFTAANRKFGMSGCFNIRAKFGLCIRVDNPNFTVDNSPFYNKKTGEYMYTYSEITPFNLGINKSSVGEIADFSRFLSLK